VYPLYVEGGRNWTQFPFDSPKATKQELTEAHHLLDNPEGEIYGRLASTIDLSSLGHLEAVFNESHGIFRFRIRRAMPSVFESQVMLLSSEGDEGSDVCPVTQFDVRSAEVTGIGQKRLRAAEFFRECGQGFHCVGKFVPVHRGSGHPVGQNQSTFIVQNSLAVIGLF
jgi:hypothetical protein